MRVFHGWIIVAVGIVASCIGMGSLMSLGVFLMPISQTMGWSRGEISVASTLSFIAMGAGSFLWGMLSDRFGTRVVVITGAIILGAALLLASQATTLLSFQLVFGIGVGLASGSFYVPMTTLTVRWFTRNRSLAVALVSMGLGMGTTVIAPLSGWMIAHYDWRSAMMVLGLLGWGVILPATMLLREPARNTTGQSQAAATLDSSMTLGKALVTPQFLAITLAFLACCMAHSGPIFHMVSYVADCGIPDLTATTVFSVAGLSGLVGRIVCGLIADRVGAKQTLVAGLALQAAAILFWLFVGGLSGFYIAAAVFGFAYGGVMPLYAILVRESFPARIMGSVFGVVAMVSTFGMAIGPWLGGWLYDHVGGYFWLYVASASIGAGASAIALLVRRPGADTSAPRLQPA